MTLIEYFLVGLIAFMTGSVCYEAYSNKQLRNTVITLETQIAELKKESELKELRATIAQTQAQEQMKQVQQETKEIIAEKIPKGCDEVIKWAISKARGL